MKREQIGLGFVVLWSMALFNLVACGPAGKTSAAEGPAAIIVDVPVASSEWAAGPSCTDPTPETAAGCAAQAERALASTVRLEFHGPGGGIGHATVIGGRYLITHNHYPVSGDALSRGGDGLVTAISVSRANGDVVLLKAPLVFFSVEAVAPEALVLDFKEYGGVGFFDSLGVPSAETASLTGVAVTPSSEVAQIDWDMTTTRVTWARVTAVRVDGDAPYLELDSFVEQGASGGGVFYNGVHIANNWSRNVDRDAGTGKVLRQYSLAALNTGALVATTSRAKEIAAVGN